MSRLFGLSCLLGSLVVLSSTRASAAPVNDAFASATVIASGSTAVSGSNVGATSQAGEPADVAYGAERSALGPNSVWWRWTPATSGTYTLSTAGSDFDTQLGVYTGGSFPLVEVASNEDNNGAQAALTGTFAAGTSYSILVAGYQGQAGTIQLSITGSGGGGVPGRFALTVQINPVGAGSTSANPPPDSDGKYAAGTVVTLAAVPAGGSTFSSWSGDLSGSANPSPITLNADKNVTANFTTSGGGGNTDERVQLSVSASPTEGGTVQISPAPDAEGKLPRGTVVTLTVSPAAGFDFERWSGARTGSANPLSLTLETNTALVAHFRAEGSDCGVRVAILTPNARGRLKKEQFTVHGVALPRSRVREVLVQVNDGPFQVARGRTAWHAIVSLQPGNNRVSVKAITFDGCESPVVSRNYWRELPPPFTAVAGDYSGLIHNADQPSWESSGSFYLSVNDRGRYSARFAIGGRLYHKSGQFPENGTTSFSLRRGQDLLQFSLSLPLSAPNNEITGTVESPGDWSASLLGDRRVFSRQPGSQAPQAGTYNLELGDEGEASLRVDVAGNFLLRGQTDRRTRFTESGFVASSGELAVSVQVGRDRSLLQGWLDFPEGGGDPRGTLLLLSPNGESRELVVGPPEPVATAVSDDRGNDRDRENNRGGGGRH